MTIRKLRQRIKSVLHESTDPEAFYRDAQGRESDYANVRSELEMIKQAGLEREYEALMKGIFALPIQEFDLRAAAIEQLKRKAEKIVGQPKTETITRSQLKEVIKETLRTILKEMYGRRRVLSMLEEGPISLGDLQSAWREDQSGEYVQINPDDSVWYIAHGRAREQIAPKGERNPFPKIGIWMQRGGVILNIWKVNDHGNVELMSRSGKELGGLAEQIYEMTTTGAVAPINLPGNVKGGWVASKGGSARGVAGSKALGYELTPIGKKDMARKQDPVY